LPLPDLFIVFEGDDEETSPLTIHTLCVWMVRGEVGWFFSVAAAAEEEMKMKKKEEEKK